MKKLILCSLFSLTISSYASPLTEPLTSFVRENGTFNSETHNRDLYANACIDQILPFLKEALFPTEKTTEPFEERLQHAILTIMEITQFDSRRALQDTIEDRLLIIAQKIVKEIFSFVVCPAELSDFIRQLKLELSPQIGHEKTEKLTKNLFYIIDTPILPSSFLYQLTELSPVIGQNKVDEISDKAFQVAEAISLHFISAKNDHRLLDFKCLNLPTIRKLVLSFDPPISNVLDLFCLQCLEIDIEGPQFVVRSHCGKRLSSFDTNARKQFHPQVQVQSPQQVITLENIESMSPDELDLLFESLISDEEI